LVPRDEVLISDLVAFRERYDDERRRLMLALDLLTPLRKSALKPAGCWGWSADTPST
jgi:hypothetical protein